MSGKRYTWKTIGFRSSNDWRQIQSYVGSQEGGAFSRWTIKLNSTGGGGGELETNLPISQLRAIARNTGVRINWDRGVLWDTQPSWEGHEAISLVRHPQTDVLHFIMDDPDAPIYVSLCGDGHAGDWPKATHLPEPVELRNVCRDCCKMLGHVAEHNWPRP